MEVVRRLLSELAGLDVKLVVEDGKLNCYAPKGALTPELADAIARCKPELLRVLAEEADAQGVAAAAIAEFPLSVGESTHYLLQQLNPLRSHAVPICVEVHADIDRAVLADAWDRLLDRHPILMARIVEREGVPVHRIDPACRAVLREEALPLERSEDVVAHFQARVLEPFDLQAGPLCRITLFTWGGGRVGLFVLIHHIVSDGFSSGVLLRALFDAYRDAAAGRPAPAPASACGYEAFVEWERTMLDSADGRKHADYWKAQLQGDLSGFRLLPDAPRPLPPGYEPEIVVDTLPDAVARRVREYCAAKSVLPSAFFLAVFQMLLHKYSGQKDIVAVMPVVVRPEERFRDEIGYFFNIVPLRANFEQPLTAAGLMQQMQGRVIDALFHGGYPFPLMMHRQKGSDAQDFRIYYAYQEFGNLSDPSFVALRREFGLVPFEGFRQKAEGDFDIAFEVFPEEGSFRIHLQSDPNLYPNDTIRALMAHFRVLLDGIGRDPDRPVAEYPIATEEDRRRVLQAWNDTPAGYPRDRCIHAFFLDNVAAMPDRPAVLFEGRTVSYRELGEATHALALVLQAHGVRPDTIVALCVERSVEMMTGITGILHAGGAYMPIDPDYPDDRVAWMLEDSNATVLLTQAKHRDRVAALAGEGMRVIALDADWDAVLREAATLAAQGRVVAEDVGPTNVAYVIFTSGSTGKPKGVLVEHRALVNRVHWMQKAYPMDHRDIVVQKTPYCFDVSVWEFVWPPMVGAALAFAVPNGHSDAQYMESLIRGVGVTTLHFVPSMLHTFLDNNREPCDSVRFVFCSGEALDRHSVDRYRKAFPNAALHNLYGPTEAAIDVTFYDCTKIEYPFVPIGAPIDNTRIYIVDAHNNPQPVGVPGELHIAGDNLARGYLNRPELTRERFIDNPFEPGARMYRTGDLARWLDDGNIQYLGRIDDQVKIGGVRIETGEIEANLNRHPAISESVVIARGPDGYKQLIAFYRAAGSREGDVVALAHGELRAHLLETLPEYMIPAAFVAMPAMPVTSNGKADRRALSKIEVGLESSREYVAPRNETERRLAEIWAYVFKEKGFVLEQAKIGVDDNFFELGGNSLLATQLLYRIRSAFGVELPVRALFEQVTIAQLADTIGRIAAGDARAAAAGPAVAIQPHGTGPAVFALPGVGGNVLSYRELSRALGPEQPFHAVEAIGLDGSTPPPDSVEATAQANLAAIRAIQPQGPYRLVGHSYGGVIAYEMARSLLAQGERVEYLALLDAATPEVLFAADAGAGDEAEDMRRLCAELAEQNGRRFDLSADALRAMPVDDVLVQLEQLGIPVDRDRYEALTAVFRANREAYRRYRPAPLPGPIEWHLFRATRSMPASGAWPGDYGWRAVAGAAPTLHDVDADHHSILHGAAVTMIAGVLAEASTRRAAGEAEEAVH